MHCGLYRKVYVLNNTLLFDLVPLYSDGFIQFVLYVYFYYGKEVVHCGL